MRIRVYLAAHYSRKEEVALYAGDLKARGIVVVSGWHRERTGPDKPFQESSVKNRYRVAKKDLAELDLCTHFVLLTVDPEKEFTRGGHCWENGYAAAKGKVQAIVGPKQLLFHWLPKTRQFNTWEECMDWLIKENEHD